MGLRMFVPWGVPNQRAGMFSAVRFPSDPGRDYFDSIVAGAPTPPIWYPDPVFGPVPDFGNDTVNRALTTTERNYEWPNASPLTLTGWVWPHVQEDNAVVFGKYVQYQAGWVLRLRKNSTQMGFRFEVQYATTNLAAVVSKVGVLAANRWTHIAVTWPGDPSPSSVLFYVDGVPLTDNPSNTTPVGLRKDDSSRAYCFGASNFADPPTGKFKGRLGPLKLYSRVLTASEIREDFLDPLGLIVPPNQRLSRRSFFIPDPAATQILEVDRTGSWNIREFVDSERVASFNVESTATEVYAERSTSFNVEATTLVAWPKGPINKPVVGEYEVRVITPTLIELVLIHTNANAEQRPSRWNFVGQDWISLTTLPAASRFVVRQTPP